MWKTNSAQARANVRQYIRENTDFSDYPALKMIDAKEATFSSLSVDILNVFRTEKLYVMNKHNEFLTFLEWTQGLPPALDCCYWYNRSAVDDLGKILEQTPEEKSKYSESNAGLMLTKLIYRELIKGEEKYRKTEAK